MANTFVINEDELFHPYLNAIHLFEYYELIIDDIIFLTFAVLVPDVYDEVMIASHNLAPFPFATETQSLINFALLNSRLHHDPSAVLQPTPLLLSTNLQVHIEPEKTPDVSDINAEEYIIGDVVDPVPQPASLDSCNKN